jgi:hypothetical protein
MSSDEEESVRTVIEAELRLLEPAVRADPDSWQGLLDPAFTEIGSSGRCWDRSSVQHMMAASAHTGDHPVTVTQMAGVVLAPGIVHLSYLSEAGDRWVRRSSLWRRHQGTWRLFFHQGTPTAEEPPTALG